MGADEVIKSRFGYETECKGALRIEPLSPGSDDAGDGLVGFMPDEPDGLVACEAPQRLDLVTDGGGNAGHVEIPPRSNRGKIEHASVDQEADRRTRAREPVANIQRDRQDRFVSDQGFTQNAGEEAGGAGLRERFDKAQFDQVTKADLEVVIDDRPL